MSVSLILKRGTSASLAAALRSISGAQSPARLRFPASRGAAAAVLGRELQCNAAVNAHSCTQTAVEDCLDRVLGPSAPSRSEFAVVFYEGHDGAQVQKALESFASSNLNEEDESRRIAEIAGTAFASLTRLRRLLRSWVDSTNQHQRAPAQKAGVAFAAWNPDAPPVIGCSLGESGQLQHVEHPPRDRKSELAGGHFLGAGDRSRGKEAVASKDAIVIAPHPDSDSDGESDATETGLESEADGDADSMVFRVRDNGGGEGSDDGFGGDALIELLGNVDDVIDALEEPRGGKKKGRNGRRARRMAKKKHLEQQLQLGKRMSMRLVTALGLGFEGRAQAVPVVMANGAFPDLGKADTVRRIFGLPKERPPHFLLLCRRNAAPGLEKSLDRLGNLLPGGTRLAAVSAGERPSVVSSFPATGKACVGVCLIGYISVQEQAELASKTFGAFSVSDVRVLGGACEELFVPRNPSPLPSPPLESESEPEPELQPMSVSTPEGTRPPSPKTSAATKTARVGWKTGPSQLCVFKVDDFVYPGMRRRYHIFEPRYRALVKRCLRDGQALLLLPLSGDGNNFGTAAYVSGLYNVHEDGRCDIEITGLARCQVQTMWMRGESFGLYEAVVEYFEDEDTADAASDMADPEGSDVALLSGQERGSGGESESESGAGEGDAEGAGERPNPRSYSELQQLRVLVSAVLHRELFRTWRTGFSPMWPTWRGNGSDIAADLLARASGDAADDSSSGFSSGLADLDAESLSFWAAQHVAADPETKLRWLTCTSTEARLRDITAKLTDRAALMARRSGGGGGGGGGNDNLYNLLRDIYASKGGRGDGHGRDR